MIGTSTWARSPEVAWVETSEYTVVLRLDETRPSPKSLDATASAIWASLGDEPRRLDTIVDELATAYGVAPDEIADDICGFLDDLHGAGLVTLRTMR